MPTGQWFYTRNGQQQGPASLDDLRALAQRGELTAQDLVWTETMANWQPAHTVPGLVAGGAPVPPSMGTSAGQFTHPQHVPSAYQSGPFTGIFPQVDPGQAVQYQGPGSTPESPPRRTSWGPTVVLLVILFIAALLGAYWLFKVTGV